MERREKEGWRIGRESGVNKGKRLNQREKEREQKRGASNEQWKENGRPLETFCLPVPLISIYLINLTTYLIT